MLLRVSNFVCVILVGICFAATLKYFEPSEDIYFWMRALFVGGLVLTLCYLLGSF